MYIAVLGGPFPMGQAGLGGLLSQGFECKQNDSFFKEELTKNLVSISKFVVLNF